MAVSIFKTQNSQRILWAPRMLCGLAAGAWVVWRLCCTSLGEAEETDRSSLLLMKSIIRAYQGPVNMFVALLCKHLDRNWCFSPYLVFSWSCICVPLGPKMWHNRDSDCSLAPERFCASAPVENPFRGMQQPNREDKTLYMAYEYKTV